MVTNLDHRVSAEPRAEVVGGIGVGRAFSSNITYEPPGQMPWEAVISFEIAVATLFEITATDRPPPVPHQDLIQSDMLRINAAKVRRNAQAISFLARLYEDRVIALSELGNECSWPEGAALAQLAGALLCDVDQTSIRITDRGVTFVKDLVDLARS